MSSYKPGDTIKVRTKKETYLGVVIPNEHSETLILKLDSGYNVGILENHIEHVDLIASGKRKIKNKGEELSIDSKKPTIAILHTGGTIASKVDYTSGGVVADFTPEELVAMFPELNSIANVKSDLLFNAMSEDFTFTEYAAMRKGIEKHLAENVDGIIIAHGTDTLGYTAAAMSFIFENLPVPIILVGAQRSSDRGSSDAAMNIINAAYFINKSNFKGVAVCMHDSTNDDRCVILPGTKTRKMHTSRRDAFKAINSSPLAYVDYRNNTLEELESFPETNGPLEIYPHFEDKVALVKVYPNMKAEQLLMYKHYKGIVLEGTGLGHTPVGKHDSFIEAVKKLIKMGVIVTLTSQCIYGRVHPHVYTNLRKLSNVGVLYGEDMLPETAYIKLAWLLGNFSFEVAQQKYGQNLRGEINQRILDTHYLS